MALLPIKSSEDKCANPVANAGGWIQLVVKYAMVMGVRLFMQPRPYVQSGGIDVSFAHTLA